jgi:hypothetical protein
MGKIVLRAGDPAQGQTHRRRNPPGCALPFWQVNQPSAS